MGEGATARKSTLGENPLETTVDGVKPKSFGNQTPGQKRDKAPLPQKADDPKRIRVSFHLPEDLAEKVRDCVYWLSGPPHRLTMGSICEQALEREVKRLQKEGNGGKPFAPREQDLKGGARVS